MKKIVWGMMAGVLLLTACQNSESKPKTSEAMHTSEKPQAVVATKTESTFPYPNLLAEKDHSYSLLVIGEQDGQTPIEDDQEIIKDVKNILSLPTVAMVQKIYPELQINTNVAYILFDNSGVVHQSKSLKEFTNFLQKNPAKE